MQRKDGTFQKRMQRWDSGPAVRYLTFGCFRRVQLFGSPAARNDFAACLARAKERYGFRLIAWVVMPEHVHLILMPPQTANDTPLLAAILRSIKQPVAQRLIRSYRLNGLPVSPITTSGGEVRMWEEGGGFDRNVRTLKELEREIGYIHMNPVRRGLVKDPVEWEWSSARWCAGLRDDAAGWGGQIAIDRTGIDWGIKTYT